MPDGQWNKAIAWLQYEIIATADGDYESKAILLHAVSMVGKADFTMANRLYRERQGLSAAAIVYSRWPWLKWTANRRPKCCIGSTHDRNCFTRQVLQLPMRPTLRRSKHCPGVSPRPIAGSLGRSRPGGFAAVVQD